MATGTLAGGRPTGGRNVWIDSLVNGGAWADAGGAVEITYALQSGDDPFDFFTLDSGLRWLRFEETALAAAMQTWEDVARIDFVRTARPGAADIWYWLGTDRDFGGNVLGGHELPGFAIEPLYGMFNAAGYGWTRDGLKPGGIGYFTLLHELGHGLGLAHPHDGGAARDATIFPGVDDPFRDFGKFGLNQGIFTVMSYNAGSPAAHPGHRAVEWGWHGTPMALDIAAVQRIYGANLEHRTGNDTYRLPGSNGPGTFWSAIWDAGGTDRISFAGGSVDAVIDLRAAPLTGPDAGGYISAARGIVGGFTIANGVLIEKATGGGEDDWISGNAAENRLAGQVGDDRIIGRGGDDRLLGGQGDDHLRGGGADDRLRGGSGEDLLQGGPGEDRLSGGSGHDRLWSGSAGDRLAGGAGRDVLRGRRDDDILIGGGGRDKLFGGSGADRLSGGPGRDLLDAGADTERDVFRFRSVADSLPGAPDTLRRVSPGEDRIDLRFVDADAGRAGNQAFGWSDGAAAHAVWTRNEGRDMRLMADVDGDGVADLELFFENSQGIGPGDILF